MQEYKRRIRKWQIVALLLVIWDFFCVVAAYGLALYLRFDCEILNIPKEFFDIYKNTVYHYAWISVLFYILFKLYNRNWRYASYIELVRCVAASAIPILGYSLVLPYAAGRMPISYHAFGGLLQFSFLLFSRFIFPAYIQVHARL